ncbi:hypothetical protein GQ457_12G012740 [Hibiscus cannabinus]
MFDQFVMNLKQEQYVVQAVVAPSRAPIEKLLQHRAYSFVGTIEVKPEEEEYWLEHITQIVTKQLSCSDEQKLECAVALLVDEALSWWETTTLTTPTEKVAWEFFMVEFKKKYISEQHFEERRKKFLYSNQGRKPISQYASKFRNYSEYGSETREECSRQKAKRFGSNHIPRLQSVIRPPFPIDDDRPQWQSKKDKYHHENPITYTPVSRSNFTPRPPDDIKLAIPTNSVSSERNLEKILACEFCQKWHWGLCRIQYNLCYACGGDDHFIKGCPRNIQKVSTQPPAELSFILLVRNKGSKQVQFGNQGRGKGNLKTSTHEESRIPVRVYHAEERDDEKSLEIIIEESVQILDWDIKRLRNKSVPLVKVLWKNHRVEEVTWETEVAMQEQYPHLFESGKNSRTNSLLRGESCHTLKIP